MIVYLIIFMNKMLIAGVVLFLIAGMLAGGILSGMVAISQEPPYFWFTSSDHSSGEILPVPIYSVAYVFPNGSFILEGWTYDPSPFTFTTSGLHAYPMAYIPGIGPSWAAYDGVTGALMSKNPNYIYPFSFSYANAWFGDVFNFTYPDAVGETYQVQFLQPAQDNMFHYNGSGENQITITYGFINSQWGNGTFENFTYLGVGPTKTTVIVQNTQLPYQTAVIPANSTHIWVAVPNWRVYSQEIPQNFPYKNLVKTTNAPLPSWWNTTAIQ